MYKKSEWKYFEQEGREELLLIVIAINTSSLANEHTGGCKKSSQILEKSVVDLNLRNTVKHTVI